MILFIYLFFAFLSVVVGAVADSIRLLLETGARARLRNAYTVDA